MRNGIPSDRNTVAGVALPKIAYGRGSELFDTTGKRYLDGSGGPAVYCLGHAHPEVNEAIKAQLDRIAHGYRYNFTSDPLEELTERIARACGGALQRMVFVSSGSEAVESALKIALQYQTAIGAKSRRRFIARERSWHGNTLMATSLSGFKDRRDAFEGALMTVGRVSMANAYRPLNGAAGDALVEALAAELEAKIIEMGPDTVAAFIFEPVVGAAGGCVPAPPGYAKAVQAVCARHGVLLIADEVMCGSGRSGTWRSLEQDGVEPDIMAVAKGLAGGYVPLGATIYSDRIADAMQASHGGPLTGHTFTGHTLACAAGVAVQRIIERDGLIARVHEKEALLRRLIAEALAGVESVGDIRGRGYFIGIEFVANRDTKQPFAADKKFANRLRQTAFSLGLICYPSGGSVDGVAGDTAIIAPPYNASDAELEEIADLFGKAVRHTLVETGG